MGKKKSDRVSVTLPRNIYEQMDDCYRIEVIESILLGKQPPSRSKVYAQVLGRGLDIVKSERGIEDFKLQLQEYRIDKRKR